MQNYDSKINVKRAMVDVLLAPISEERFFNQYWEQESFHIERKDQTHLSNILSSDEIKALIERNIISYPQLSLTQLASKINSDDYTNSNNVANANQVFALYEAGATVVLSNVVEHFSALSQLVQSLIAETQMRWQANMYLTPAANQGFAPHYDTHDVFILQIEGQKKFRFFTSELKLPFPEDNYDIALNAHPQLCEEVTLAAGDTLYIPRGHVHDAQTVGDEPSLHVTLGCYPMIQRDLLQCYMQVAAEQMDNLRQSVPRSLWLNPASSIEQNEVLQNALLDIVHHPESAAWFEEAIERLKDEFALSLGLPDNQDSQKQSITDTVNEAITLDANSRIFVRQNRILSIQTMDDHCQIRCPGRLLEFEHPLSAAVDYLVAQKSVTLNELPEVTLVQAIALIKQLLADSIVYIGNEAN